jgi:hypothetical protein
VGRLGHIAEWLSLGRGHSGLVLDVGSGNSPHPRADVLVDRFIVQGTPHRFGGATFRGDRPSVCGDIAALPFRDGAFAFAIARHVIEHLSADDACRAVAELARVSRAGYIETPSPLCELLMPDPNHQLYVWVDQGELVVAPKADQFPVPHLARHLLEWRRRDKQWLQFMSDHEAAFTTKIRWTGHVRCRPGTPVTSADDSDIAACLAAYDLAPPPSRSDLRDFVRHVMYRLAHLR